MFDAKKYHLTLIEFGHHLLEPNLLVKASDVQHFRFFFFLVMVHMKAGSVIQPRSIFRGSEDGK